MPALPSRLWLTDSTFSIPSLFSPSPSSSSWTYGSGSFLLLTFPPLPPFSLCIVIPLPHFYSLSSVSRALDTSPRTLSFHSSPRLHVNPHADLSFYRTITRVWHRLPGWIVPIRHRAVLVFLSPPLAPSCWTPPLPLPPLPFPSFFSPPLCRTDGLI